MSKPFDNNSRASLQDRFQAARQLHLQGHLAEAERAYRDILHSAPANFEATHLLGVALLQRGEVEASAVTLQRALALQPGHAGACSNHGNALRALRRFEAAVAQYDAAIALNPGFAAAHYNKGVALFELGRFEAAAASYGAALDLQPDDAEAHLNLGNARRMLGQLAAALDSFDRALGLAPLLAEAHYGRGAALRDLGRRAEAIASFGRAIELSPGLVSALLRRAELLGQAGEMDRALADFDRAIDLAPASAEGHFGRAVLLHGAGRAAEALPGYEAALRLDAGWARAHNNRGVALRQLNWMPEALLSFDQALQSDPAFAEALRNQAALLQELGRHEEAIRVCDQAMSLLPDDPQFPFLKAGSLCLTGATSEALACYDLALRRDPLFAEAHNDKAVLLSELKRHDEAMAAFAAAIAARPDYAEAHESLAPLMLDAGRLEEAQRLLGRLLALRPASPEAHCAMGRLHLRRQQVPLAIACFRKAIGLQPDYARAHYLLGTVVLDAKRYEEAIACFDAAIRAAPGDAEAHNARGIALASLNRAEEAIASFRQAVAANPIDPSPCANLSEALSALGRFEEAEAHARKAIEIQCQAEAGGDMRVLSICAGISTLSHLPAIYETEQQVEAARARLQATLAQVSHRLDEYRAESPGALKVFGSVAFRFSGFYIAYQQKNDREIMRSYASSLSRMLGIGADPAPARRRSGGAIRIGIASETLYHHNGSRWAYDWFSQLPPGYEFFTYAFHMVEDEVAARFARLGTHRRLELRADNCREVVDVMRGDALDILMLPDVGMTPSSRVLSLHRIAPVQFTAWGHPVTTGSAKMDYYLSSDLMEPPDAQDHYSEKLVRLPNLALFLRPPKTPVAAGGGFGLPGGRRLFGCLQSLYKYLPLHDVVFPRIAAAVPEALFVFLQGHPSYMTAILQQRLARAFEAEGLDAAKHVLFLPRLPTARYAALMAQMDVILDSIGWSGGNSTLDAIEAGIPILTLPGAFMRGRHSYAMLKMIGLNALIADSLDDFVRRGIRLGRDRDLRAQLRAELLAGKAALYEDRTFISGLDAFLRSCMA